MKMDNYKILEDRSELTPEQVAAGMSFSMVQKKVFTPKTASLKITIISAVVTVAVVSGIFIYRASSLQSKNIKDQPVINDTIKENKIIINTDTILPELKGAEKIPEKKRTNDSSYALVRQEEKVVIEEVENTEEIKPVHSLSFQRLSNADSENAIEIKDSIYGPVNVSKGYGEYFEYGVKTNLFYSEMNSAWFKFTIKRDTLLTFHIVPTLGTDDYDFALFKYTSGSCERALKTNKLKPERICFSWNSSQNKNTGLSNMAKDTLFEQTFANGEKQGKTYAAALKVKAGEIFYLMVTNNLRVQKNQDPEGFMIYFYNYLPKNKANKYK